MSPRDRARILLAEAVDLAVGIGWLVRVVVTCRLIGHTEPVWHDTTLGPIGTCRRCSSRLVAPVARF